MRVKVFTNGCFDLLHIGHIHLLREAKKMGDYLIVGINSDYSVKKLKGNDRPINTETERKTILESIKYVDEVIIFEEETPIKLLQIIKPDVHVKGGDYIAELLPEYDTVIKNGGTVKIVELYGNKSTTKIIANLIN
jgi:glycerol-3-phosphate cytidylyltransferase